MPGSCSSPPYSLHIFDISRTRQLASWPGDFQIRLSIKLVPELNYDNNKERRRYRLNDGWDDTCLCLRPKSLAISSIDLPAMIDMARGCPECMENKNQILIWAILFMRWLHLRYGSKNKRRKERFAIPTILIYSYRPLVVGRWPR